MVFKLAASFIALAAVASAAHIKRVACPDGKNFATNAAVRFVSDEWTTGTNMNAWYL